MEIFLLNSAALIAFASPYCGERHEPLAFASSWTPWTSFSGCGQLNRRPYSTPVLTSWRIRRRPGTPLWPSHPHNQNTHWSRQHLFDLSFPQFRFLRTAPRHYSLVWYQVTWRQYFHPNLHLPTARLRLPTPFRPLFLRRRRPMLRYCLLSIAFALFVFRPLSMSAQCFQRLFHLSFYFLPPNSAFH